MFKPNLNYISAIVIVILLGGCSSDPDPVGPLPEPYAISIEFDGGDDPMGVYPDFEFFVSGEVISDHDINDVSYCVMRGEGSGPIEDVDLDAYNRFRIKVAPDKRLTGVLISVTDVKENVYRKELPVFVMHPSRTEYKNMVHYENLLFTDSRKFDCSYFSFDVPPYVLNSQQAFANQDKVHLMYYNLFLSEESTMNGAALFGANAYSDATIRAGALAEGWTIHPGDLQLCRVPGRTEEQLLEAIGKSFDEIGDSVEEWSAISQWILGLYSENSVVRCGNATSMTVAGSIFVIQYGGTTSQGNDGINKCAIAIVRGKGGTRAMEQGESTGAWLSIEIKAGK